MVVCRTMYVLTVERKPATAPRHVAGVVLVEHGAALVLPHPGQGAVRARLAEDLTTPHVSRVSEATKDAQKLRESISCDDERRKNLDCGKRTRASPALPWSSWTKSWYCSQRAMSGGHVRLALCEPGTTAPRKRAERSSAGENQAGRSDGGWVG